jgi:hypothetical protein
MVSAEELNRLFEYRDGKLYWKYVEGRRKETNNRFVGKEAGCEQGHGYRTVSYKIGNKKYKQLLHRVIYALHHDSWPELIDHIDRDPTNNRIGNLRPASKKLNAINTSRLRKNSSGFRGVCWNRLCKRWEAHIKNDSSKVHLGLFHCLGEAIKARKDAEKLYWSDV